MNVSESAHRNDDSHWRAVPSRYGGFMTRNQARNWALVLDSRSIPCYIDSAGAGWRLLVPEEHYESACNELRLYEENNRHWPPPLPAARSMIENTLPTVSILILLATFHNLTLIGFSLPEYGLLDLHALGTAHAEKILDGQWWRLVTALTLHADMLHLISNLIIGGVFIILLCRELGTGLAWSLLLACGGLGNLANAWLHSPGHQSVGASTAVFGAVGLMAAISMVRYRHHLQQRAFIPIAAGLALLAILGTEGKNTDLGAHLCGFCFGILFGTGAEHLTGKYGRPGALLNILLSLFSGTLVVAAWWAAIELGGK